jgi:hypothetical protein
VQPVAFETTGAWGPATNTFLTQLRKKLVRFDLILYYFILFLYVMTRSFETQTHTRNL